PRQPERFAIGAFPVWCLQPAPDQGLIYGPPMPALPGANWEGGPIGLKVAHHLPGAPAAPDTVDRHPQTGDFDLLRNTLRRHLPAADGPPTGMRVCLYSNSPDHHFLIDRTPEGITFAAGFSGHGFKFASAIGEALADLAIDGKTALPMEFLRLQRLPK
ncbi:MAG TPA: FAD-dependent oxidoreductase, partial [Phycisphaerae bacterium]|nr:FAD-dependent oxidoreductase [Phycisphaerae bacterium]